MWQTTISPFLSRKRLPRSRPSTKSISKKNKKQRNLRKSGRSKCAWPVKPTARLSWRLLLNSNGKSNKNKNSSMTDLTNRSGEVPPYTRSDKWRVRSVNSRSRSSRSSERRGFSSRSLLQPTNERKNTVPLKTRSSRLFQCRIKRSVNSSKTRKPLSTTPKLGSTLSPCAIIQ